MGRMLRYIGETNEHFVKNGVYKEILIGESDWKSTQYQDIAKALDTTTTEAHRARTIISDNGDHVLMTVQQALEKFCIVYKDPVTREIEDLRKSIKAETKAKEEQRAVLNYLFTNYVAYTKLNLWHGYEDREDGEFDVKVNEIIELDNRGEFRINFFGDNLMYESFYIFTEDLLDLVKFVPANDISRLNTEYALKGCEEQEEDTE